MNLIEVVTWICKTSMSLCNFTICSNCESLKSVTEQNLILCHCQAFYIIKTIREQSLSDKESRFLIPKTQALQQELNWMCYPRSAWRVLVCEWRGNRQGGANSTRKKTVSWTLESQYNLNMQKKKKHKKKKRKSPRESLQGTFVCKKKSESLRETEKEWEREKRS